MKTKHIKRALALLLSLLMLLGCFVFVSCSEPTPTDALWENALYDEDKTFGDGAKTVAVQVIAGEKSVTFTVKTDKETLDDALLEHGLVEGEDGAYGLYVKKVNGILADYDVDQTYWSLSKNGETLMTGVSGETVTDGAHYEFTQTK